MCGYAGFIDLRAETSGHELEQLAHAMADQVRHRGPDDGGTWADPAVGVALGHRRLSIVDLSPLGGQPMVSSDGRFVLAYNGEIYNFRALADDLRAGGTRFRGYSDTEVLLEGCVEWGVEGALERLNGMFSFALWDRHTQTLTLARDRLGIKPLYWGRQQNVVFFGSQPKCFLAHPAFEARVDRTALASYLRFGYVPAPQSIYEGIAKLPPGQLVRIHPDGTHQISTYWDLRRIAAEGVRHRLEGSDSDLTDQLEELLLDAVGRRMVADVPLGAFLSGGIDSSTVVALMQAQSSRPVRTFSIGFGQDLYNEAVHAAAVAKHLGTEHTELYVEPDDAMALIPRLPEWFDEPFGDSSQVPTSLVSHLTRKHVTVALSGDGGDELFGGYNRYSWGSRLHNGVAQVPRLFRQFGAAALRALSPDAWNRLARIVPARRRVRLPGEKMHKLADLIALESEAAVYETLVSCWTRPNDLVAGAQSASDVPWDRDLEADVPDPKERMQLLDSLTYLPDDILAKVDRASMSVGLEARVPLLDHRVVELSWRLRSAMKADRGPGKWVLRRVLDRHVPVALTDRPKMGFAVPIDTWLRGPLRDWAESLLDARRLGGDGYLNAAPIRKAWNEHTSERLNRHHELWTVLMFQAWLEHSAESVAPARDSDQPSRAARSA